MAIDTVAGMVGRYRMAAACLVVASVVVLGGEPAQAAPSVAPVPFGMDASNQAAWWHPLDEWQGMPYVAYNAPGSQANTHTVWIARRDGSGTWFRGCLPAASGCAEFTDDLGHSQPTIAIDGDGYIHAFVSMHNINWRYYRSSTPGAVTHMVNRSAEMPDQGGQYTYPSATKAQNGDVYLIIREHPAGRLYRWNNASNAWSRAATFANQSGFVVYPDDVVADGAGNVHIAWEWATDIAPGRHNASYLRYSPATNQFTNAAGTVVSTPVGVSGAVIYQPLEGEETLTGTNANIDPGVRGAKLAVDPGTLRPRVAYRYRPTAGGHMHIRLASWTGSAWQRETVYAGAYDTFAAVDITVNGSALRVYYAKNQTVADNHAFAATRPAAGGAWVETLLLSGVPVERLSVTRRGTVDHLYLASPSTAQLFYGTLPW